MKNSFRNIFAAVALGVVTHVAQAQGGYPEKPIRFVLGTGAGSGADTVARLLADKMGPLLNGTFVIDNRPGAGGSIAAEAVARAAPDGYTMLLGGYTTHVLLPTINSNLPYDPIKDFTPIGSAATASILVVANNDFPANNLKELMALAKSKPGLQYASWGNGSTGHFCAELLNQKRQLGMEHIPYKTTSQIVTDVIGGHVQLAYLDVASGAPMVKAGRAKAIGQCVSRNAVLPDVGSYEDEGIDVDGMKVSPPMQAFFFPANTPKPIVDKVAAALKTVLEMPDVKARMLEMGNIAAFENGETLKAHLISDAKAWKIIAERANITAN